MVAALSGTRPARPLEGRDDLEALRERMRAATLRPETDAVEELRRALLPLEGALEAARTRAMRWVEAARGNTRSRPLAESLLEQFPLDSAPGQGAHEPRRGAAAHARPRSAPIS